MCLSALVDITCTLLLLNPDFTTAWNVRYTHLVTDASAYSSGCQIFIQQVFSSLNWWLFAVAGRSCCSVESSTRRRTCTWASWPSPSSPRAPRRGSTGKSLTLMAAVFVVTHTGLSRRCSLLDNLVDQQKPDYLMLLKIISPDFPAVGGFLSFLTYVEEERGWPDFETIFNIKIRKSVVWGTIRKATHDLSLGMER